jgi:hypothetical protein
MLIVALVAVERPVVGSGSPALTLQVGDARSSAGRQRAANVVAAVSRDSLEAMVRFVSVDPVSQSSRTRFVLRETPLAFVTDSLAARLERYTGGPVDRLPFAFVDSAYSKRDSTFTAQNIVARIEGTGAIPGVVLITAHYDAIALRTADWSDHWQMWPAPGADDNGTGVGALMEAARVLPHHDLPFDVMFVLFSAEELDRLGSKDFVSRYEGLYGERIIGLLNADMLGYAFAGLLGGTIITNYTSGWFAEMIRESARARDPSLPLTVVLPGPPNSDHASFWDSSCTAVTFTEPLDEHVSIVNPAYHTLGDTIVWIDFEQVERLTNLMVGFMADIGSAPADITLFPTDVTILLNGSPTLGRRFQVGDAIGVRVRIRNRGAGQPPAGARGRLVVSVENSRGARTVTSDELDLPGALDFRQITVPITLGPEFHGGNRFRAEVFVLGMEDDPDNNAVEVWVGVEGAGVPVLMHAVQPNPIEGTFRSAAFCINLVRAVDIGLELYTLEGERLGSAYLGARWGNPLEPGMNCLELGTLFPRIDRLASGIYLYRLVLYEEGAARMSYPGRFAVEN